MTEKQLQYNCVTWFHNTHKQSRGMLFEVNNNTTHGASRKSVGMVKGAADLVYCSPEGMFCSFELKADGSTHKIDHLQTQYNWARDVSNRGGCAFFIYSLEQFKMIVSALEQTGVTVSVFTEAERSRKYILSSIVGAANQGNKSCTLKYI